MKVCVTGGAGFIGSHLAERLAAEGHEVVVIDNLATGSRTNLAGIPLRFIEGSILNTDVLDEAFDGCEAVLHQAALGSVPRSIDCPENSHAANATGTLNVLQAARRAGVRRVIAAGSSSVYGANPELPRREDLQPQPVSPYAVTKLAAESYCRAFEAVYGLETVVLRYFNVFGPRQNPNLQYAAVIPLFIQAMLAGRSPWIHGDGEQSRDFTYVANVVEANLLALHAPSGCGGVYNIACGSQYSLNQLVAAINQALGLELEPEYGPPRPGDSRHSLADISRARRALSYVPEVAFYEGIRRTVAWFQEQAAAVHGR